MHLFDGRQEAIATLSQLTDEPLRVGIVSNGDREVHVTSKARLGPHGNGEPSEHRRSGTLIVEM